VDEHPEHELVGEALFLLGESHFRQESWREAAQALERLRRDSPEHQVMPKALFRLGIALVELERWAEAADALSELARRHPEFENRVEGELWRGKALAAQGKHTAARQAFERVIADDRGELAAEARLGLGALHEARDQLEEALSEYLKVALLYAHDDKVAEALFRAGSCLERLGDLEKASLQYRELLDEHEDSPFAERARERLRALRSQ
jgi:TolA-binding protein